MIVGERKPFDEIKEMIKSFKKVLNVGCGGCTSICMAGGQREVGLLNEELQNALSRREPRLGWMGSPLSDSAMPISSRSWTRS